jgi:NADH-quinone oxidoreductase subunit H
MTETLLWPERLESAGLCLSIALPLSAYVSLWLESKLGADIQARVGPNRAGHAGLLQPLADALRLISKSNPPAPSNRMRKFWWLQGLPLFAMISAVPAGADGPLLQAPFAIFVPVFLGLCFAWVGLLIGWQAERIEGRFGSIRQAALSLSAAPPALLSIAIAGMTAGGFEWSRIAEHQGFLPTHWLAASNPFAFIAGLIFLASGMLVFSLPPFSSSAGSSLSIVRDLDGTMAIREAWVRLSHRLAPICWSLVAVGVFFGGSRLPTPLEESWLSAPLHALLLVVKVLVIQVALSIAARTLPAVRADQAHDFAWRVLCPAAIIALAGLRLFTSCFSGGAS